MNNILLFIVAIQAIALLAVSIFLVFLLIELKKTIITVRRVTEEKVAPVLDGLNEALQNIRKITENVADMTGDIKQFTGSVGEIGQTFRTLGAMIGNVGTAASIKAISLKAGAKAAFQYLLENLIRKGERS